MKTQVTAVVEGVSDEGVVRAVFASVGLEVGALLGGTGKGAILKRLDGYNRAADWAPWFVLVDLDDDFDGCAVEARQAWLPAPSPGMCFRIAVREVEAWLLADAVRAAAFLGVSRDVIPADPDDLPDPKQALVNLARRSRRRSVQEGLVPRPQSGALVGPTYVSDVSAFAASSWRPHVAAQASPSLARCLDQLAKIANP